MRELSAPDLGRVEKQRSTPSPDAVERGRGGGVGRGSGGQTGMASSAQCIVDEAKQDLHVQFELD
jgi:hypothetical protein